MITLPDGIRGILFDLDGTLLDHELAARRALSAWSGDGAPASDADISRWHDIERRWFSAYERGEVSHLGQRAERAREWLGQPELSDDAALDAYSGYLAAYQDNWTPFGDAAPALADCLDAGLAVGVLTNGAHSMQAAKLAACGLDMPGVKLIATVDAGTPKPQREAYELGARTLGCEVGEVVMVGDSYANDVLGARAAGMHALYLVRPGSAPSEADSDEQVAASLSDVAWRGKA